MVPVSQTTLAAGKRNSGHDEQVCEAAVFNSSVKTCSFFFKTSSSLKEKVKETWFLHPASLQSSSTPRGPASLWGAGNEAEKKLQVIVPVLLQGKGAPLQVLGLSGAVQPVPLPKPSTSLALPCTSIYGLCSSQIILGWGHSP